MADDEKVDAQASGYSPQRAALELLNRIADLEGVSLYPNPKSQKIPATRAWILNTYRDCVSAALGRAIPEDRLDGSQWLRGSSGR